MKKQQPKIYDSIDAPIYIWQKVHETLDLSWLIIQRQKVKGKRILKALEKAWEKIYSEYIAEFGLSQDFMLMKQKELHIAKMQMQMILMNDRTLLTFIEIEQEELEEMKKSFGKVNFMDTKIAIEAKFKFQINMQSTSIKEFYSYLKHLK